MRGIALVLLVGFNGVIAGCGKSETAPTPANSGTSPGGEPTPVSVSDKDKLQGVWKIESIDTGDPKDVTPKEVLKSHRYIFHGDELSLMNMDTGRGLPSAFTLDTTKSPKRITLTRLPKSNDGDDEVSHSIYKFDGEKLILGQVGGDGPPPTEFKAIAAPQTKGAPEKGKVPQSVVIITLTKTSEPIPEFKKRVPTTGFPPPESKK